MKNLIIYDLKKRLKSPVTWILIWLILMMSYVKIEDIKAERLNRSFSGTYDTWSANLDIRMEGDEQWVSFLSEETRKKRLEIAKKIVEAEGKGDYNNYNKNEAFFTLFTAKEYMSPTDNIQYKAAEKKIK